MQPNIFPLSLSIFKTSSCAHPGFLFDVLFCYFLKNFVWKCGKGERFARVRGRRRRRDPRETQRERGILVGRLSGNNREKRRKKKKKRKSNRQDNQIYIYKHFGMSFEYSIQSWLASAQPLPPSISRAPVPRRSKHGTFHDE